MLRVNICLSPILCWGTSAGTREAGTLFHRMEPGNCSASVTLAVGLSWIVARSVALGSVWTCCPSHRLAQYPPRSAMLWSLVAQCTGACGVSLVWLYPLCCSARLEFGPCLSTGRHISSGVTGELTPSQKSPFL